MILHGRNVVEDKIKAGATEIRGYLVNKHVLRKADAAPAGQANNLIESNQFAEAGERLQNHFSSRPAPRGERGENRGFSAPYQDRNAPMRRGYGNR